MNIEIEDNLYNILKEISNIEGYENYSNLILDLIFDSKRIKNMERIGFI